MKKVFEIILIYQNFVIKIDIIIVTTDTISREVTLTLLLKLLQIY